MRSSRCSADLGDPFFDLTRLLVPPSGEAGIAPFGTSDPGLIREPGCRSRTVRSLLGQFATHCVLRTGDKLSSSPTPHVPHSRSAARVPPAANFQEEHGEPILRSLRRLASRRIEKRPSTFFPAGRRHRRRKRERKRPPLRDCTPRSLTGARLHCKEGAPRRTPQDSQGDGRRRGGGLGQQLSGGWTSLGCAQAEGSLRYGEGQPAQPLPVW
jgi:hypothetical protein